MASINKKNVNDRKTHQGGKAHAINAKQELRRSVLACMLWEKEFYENGETIASRIRDLVHKINDVEFIAQLAIDARTKHNLRHVPLLVVRELLRHKNRKEINVSDVIFQVIQRVDEITELLAIYSMDGKLKPMPGQLKKGIAKAFNNGKFKEYHFGKYNRKKDISFSDALRLVHPTPVDDYKEGLFGRIRKDTLQIPDTWEVALSGGADKKEAFTRLLEENKLGHFALIRNLRNMTEVGVNRALIKERLLEGAVNSRVLPYRYIAAASMVPSCEPMLDKAMQRSMHSMNTLGGKTLLILDHSDSMNQKLSSKSDLKRADAAAGLAILLAGICDDIEVHGFSMDPRTHWSRAYDGKFWLTQEIPTRNGMAMRDAYFHCMPMWGGTYLGAALEKLDKGKYDRMIVITDEQSQDPVPQPKGKGYMINVASNKNGVGYGKWVHIDGFSEAVVQWIAEAEREQVIWS